MKVTLVHPERRTLQSIALEAACLPKKLRPATRHDLTVSRGSALEFIARVGGHKKFGAVRLLLELEAEEGEALLPGCVCYSCVSDPAFTVHELPAREDLPLDAHKCTIEVELLPDVELGIVIANPAELFAAEGTANASRGLESETPHG